MSNKNVVAPFDGKKFNNIEPFPDKSLFSVLKWRITANRENWNTVENQLFSKPSTIRSKLLRLTMIGHSTMLNPKTLCLFQV